MCMEDVRIGRKSAMVTQQTSCPVAVNTIICPYDAQRTSLTIAMTGALAANVAPKGLTPSTGGGIRLAAGQQMVSFNIADHGLMVTQEWRGFGIGGTVPITVIAGTLEAQ